MGLIKEDALRRERAADDEIAMIMMKELGNIAYQIWTSKGDIEMLLEEGKGLMKYASEYVKQIRAADDEIAMIMMKEFGNIAYQMGWNAALDRGA